MATTDELLAQALMERPETDQDYLNIDWETRVITLPDGLENIGVYNDKDTNRLYFRCPVRYGEFQIADFGLRVNFLNIGESGEEHEGDVYLVDDAESDGEYMTFSWLVGRRAYLEEGSAIFSVCCQVINTEGNVVNELNTTVSILPVLQGLETEPDPGTQYPDYIAGLAKWIEEVTYEQVKEDLSDFMTLLETAFNSWFESFMAENQEKFDAFWTENQEKFDTFRRENQDEFNEWFEGLKDQLSEDQAGHLQNEIETNQSAIENIFDMLMSGVCSAWLMDDDGIVYSDPDDCGLVIDWPLCNCETCANYEKKGE